MRRVKEMQSEKGTGTARAGNEKKHRMKELTGEF
jgi:hypothetical protein